MAKRDRFPNEVDTKPSMKKPGTSGPAPRRRHSENAPTLPPPPAPPPSVRGKQPTARPNAVAKNKASGIKKRGAPHESDIPGATVDEVVADLTNDPRRESD